MRGHSNSVLSVAFSRDGQYLASGSGDKTVKLWLVESGECTRTMEGHSNWVYSVAFSPDGQYLASGALDNTVKLWRVESGECTRTMEGHSYGVSSVTFSPDGQHLASEEYSVKKIWDVGTGECTFTGKSLPDPSQFAAVHSKASPETNRIVGFGGMKLTQNNGHAVARVDKHVHIFELKTGIGSDQE